MRILLSVFVLISMLFLMMGCQSKSPKKLINSEVVQLDPYVIHCDHFVNIFDTTQVLTDKTIVTLYFDQEELRFTAELEEDNIQYKFTQRDTCIWRDPCIEIFLDPLADGVDYYEMEFNAGGHLWDLILMTSQPPINAPSNMRSWDIADTYSVKLDGTANDSRDKDNQWSLSGSIDWGQIKEGRPQNGDRWAYNFLRIDYDNSGRATYWVAKSTGKANIHFPDYWPVHTF